MTDRQRQALDFIRGKQRTAGPTLRELAEHLGVAYSAAQRHVEALREAGEIYTNDGNGLVLARPKAQPHPEESVRIGHVFSGTNNVRPDRPMMAKSNGRLL